MQEFKEHVSLADKVKAVEVTDAFIMSCKRMGAPIVAFGEGVEIYHKTRKGKQFAVKGDYIIDAGDTCYFVVPGIVFRSLYKEVPPEAPAPLAPPESFLPPSPAQPLADGLGVGGADDSPITALNDNDELPSEEEVAELRAKKAAEDAEAAKVEEAEEVKAEETDATPKVTI